MAENFTSQGSFGLSHFKNSRASQELFEPVYQNLFTVQIAMPVGIGSTVENTNLLLENVISISGLQSNSFPDSLAAQKYKWASRRFAGAAPATTTWAVRAGAPAGGSSPPVRCRVAWMGRATAGRATSSSARPDIRRWVRAGLHAAHQASTTTPATTT